MRRRRLVRGAVWGGVAALLLAALALLVVTSTDRGRERVRRLVLRALEDAVHGEVRIGRIEGNLLSHVRLVDFSVVDEQGRPFVSADTLDTRFGLRGLLRRRIELDDIRLVNAFVVLDRPPGEEWNYTRIFPRADPDPRGWGHWIALRDATIVGSRLLVRTAWDPGEDLTPDERQEALRRALSPDTRQNVVPVPGGHQNVMDFRELHAELPRLLIAHPDTVGMPIEVASLNGILEPYRPPAAVVLDLAGDFRFARDSLFMQDVRAVLPGSRLTGEGVYALESGDLLLRLVGAPAALADLRWLLPQLPREGGGPLHLELRRRTVATRFIISDADLTVRESRVAGRMDLTVGDTLRLQDTALRFERLDTRLVDRVIPDLELPRHGHVTGYAVLEGTPRAMRVEGDVLFDDDVAGRSRVAAEGTIGAVDGVRLTDLALRLAPLQAAMLTSAEPRLPLRGTIEGTARLSGEWGGLLEVRGDLTLRDPRGGPSRVRAAGSVDARGELTLRDLRLAFDPLHLDILREAAPELPAGGTVTGELVLNGAPARLLEVDGDLTVRDPVSGLSRVAARGGIATGDGVELRGLAMRLDPLQLALIEVMGGPDVPVEGTVTGTAVLDGDPGGRLAFEVDLEHDESGERSRVAGAGETVAGPVRSFDLDLRLEPLSLVMVGRRVPQAGLRGSVSGALQARGTLRALAVRSDLELPDGAAFSARGTLDLAGAATAYDLVFGLADFDLAGVTTRAPATTDLTGTASARGRGFDRATMEARIAADLRGVRVDDVPADEVRLSLTVAGGLVAVDSSVVRLETAEAAFDGTFGLVAARDGVLRYAVAVDSLHALAEWIPGADTAVVLPRPGARLAVAEAARAERERAIRAATVERLATGRAPPLPPAVPGVPLHGMPRDSLAGALRAVGELRGNIERFDVLGQAELENVIYQGNFVGQGLFEYHILGAGTPGIEVSVDGALRSLLVQGFAYDSATARLRYSGARFGTGSASFVAHQQGEAELDVRADFTLAEALGELWLETLRIRVDTVTWRNTRVVAVRWAGEGVEVLALELESDAGGRVFLDGRLPTEGPADLDVVIENVELAHLATLLQADVDASGLVRLDGRLRGTRAAPLLEGDVALERAVVDGNVVPDVRGTFAYAALQLTADLEVLEEGRVLGVAEVRLPVNLALSGLEGPRLLDGPIFVEVQADSLPLEAVSALTDQVAQVEGFARGAFSVRGTFDDPVLEGTFDLEGAAFRVEVLGVRFTDAHGRVRLAGSVLTVDSLVAWNRGPVRVDGTIELSPLREPSFDLDVRARGARVLNNEHGRLDVDADLAVVGPFRSVRVTGIMRTLRGVLYVPELSDLGETDLVALDEPRTFERVDTLLVQRRDLLLDRHPLLENLQVDVHVVVDRDVWLRSIEANVEIYTPPEVGPLRVRMDGWDRALSFEGTISTDRGEYEFMSRRFRLTRGGITFLGDPDMNAILQVAAEHEVRVPGRQPFTIRVLLGGSVREPTITLESTAQPPISQTDLLTYLAFGRQAGSVLPVQGSVLSGQAAASGNLVGSMAALATQQLASAAVGTLVSDLEGDAARSLGVDVFRITPADFPDELFAGRVIDLLRATEVEIGSYVSPRLFASAQARATFTRPGARLEYQTPRGLRWTASWQPVYVPTEPTLAAQDPTRRSVFGLFLLREWRH